MRRAIVGALVALSLASPAFAKNDAVVFVKSEAVKDKPIAELKPDMAYIFVRTDVSTPIYLVRDPDAQDLAAYAKLRAEAFAKVRRKYAEKLARYEADLKTAQATKGAAVPEKPVEPTEANFEFTPFHLLATATIGPMNRFSKADGASTYLQAVTPGTYRLYGSIFPTGNGGMTGICYCMGSVRFTVRAGEITDLGTARSKIDRATNLPGAFALEAAAAGAPTDSRLSAATVRPAVYRPSGKVPNYFGLAIDRLPAMAGVMRYDRDRIVDLTTGN